MFRLNMDLNLNFSIIAFPKFLKKVNNVSVCTTNVHVLSLNGFSGNDFWELPNFNLKVDVFTFAPNMKIFKDIFWP